jgi:hypothetical protein
MAAVDEQKAHLSESYIKARNDYFHRVVKWFYKEPPQSEVGDINFKCLELNNFKVLLNSCIHF